MYGGKSFSTVAIIVIFECQKLIFSLKQSLLPYLSVDRIKLWLG